MKFWQIVVVLAVFAIAAALASLGVYALFGQTAQTIFIPVPLLLGIPVGIWLGKRSAR